MLRCDSAPAAPAESGIRLEQRAAFRTKPVLGLCPHPASTLGTVRRAHLGPGTMDWAGLRRSRLRLGRRTPERDDRCPGGRRGFLALAPHGLDRFPGVPGLQGVVVSLGKFSG